MSTYYSSFIYTDVDIRYKMAADTASLYWGIVAKNNKGVI